ncbi:MAG: DUF1295 domain-containing protein [Alphaproteobacteria bacterium]|nr:DUF1295 domain-containing protein [Alphaproteobacteria bacterium]
MSEPRSPPLLVSALIPLVCAAVAGGVGWFAGQGGVAVAGVPLVAACAAVAMLVNWLAFVPAALQQTERFYDLTGSLTYLTLIAFSLGVAATDHPPGARQLVVSTMVLVWAARLGSFLFRRIQRAGKDGRFDDIKTHPLRFLTAWSLQGLWVFLTALGVLILNAQAEATPLLWTDAVGWSLWALGFGIEVVADAQKSAFKARPESEGRWIDEGLWRYSRHPNYFGEILLWTGIFVSGAGVFEGAQWLAALSPLFVTFLLTKVSGVPMLEQRADARWGDDPDYRAYKAATRTLVPWFRGASG